VSRIEHPTRLTLIQRVQSQDDDAAWNEFVEFYKSYFYVIIRRMNINASDSEDICQQIFLKVWKQIPKFEYDRERSKFRTWLTTLAHGTAVDYIRKKVRDSNKHDKAQNECETIRSFSQPEIDSMAEKEWKIFITNMALENIRKSFSGKAVQVFEMSMNGQSNESIAEELEIKIESVYLLKNRVKKKITDEIKRLREHYE